VFQISRGAPLLAYYGPVGSNVLLREVMVKLFAKFYVWGKMRDGVVIMHEGYISGLVGKN
jgi:hypothetical protein